MSLIARKWFFGGWVCPGGWIASSGELGGWIGQVRSMKHKVRQKTVEISRKSRRRDKSLESVILIKERERIVERENETG